MKPDFKNSMLLSVILMLGFFNLKAQNKVYTLQQLIDSTVTRSHLLAIQHWQVQEKTHKLKEDEIKRYPAVVLGGNYQYNFSLGELNVPAGFIGTLPTAAGDQLLPQQSTHLQLGQHQNYTADVSLYQPILQQAKIKTGLDIDRIDIALSEKEQVKLRQQLTLAVQKLYYGILISEKQLEEASNRMEAAQAKLADAESASAAGKIVTANLAGLRAAVAEEEQNILRLDITVQDYRRELASVANIDEHALNTLQAPDTTGTDTYAATTLDFYRSNAEANTELQITRLNREKAQLAIKAARQSSLPDIGLIAGYYYQKGNPILPTSSPYIGINLKWNLTDLFSNRQVTRQREAQLKQAEHAVAYQQQQLYTSIDKAYRKLVQTRALVEVAKKAWKYRQEELKIQQGKQMAGMNVKTDILEIKANLARSVSDLYAAQLSCLLATAELENLVAR
ncbi:TolC family protein [Ohtaekwangia sp.]|uniref:TolC family protein n=1 Tax=Ohtaekwangia sp. TaxID=2066019 RepID=UPI002FDDF068